MIRKRIPQVSTMVSPPESSDDEEAKQRTLRKKTAKAKHEMQL